ncbi:type II/IV secretion system ATPase subunit [Methanococcoides burtonii]|uniref:Type II secretion system protein E n=1 Tax=Methanococcoides burtonii (strain DSM 6242 / NBRC 107633 / OCM 468 / ACE-M) TaxID=259564 RepID=Q12TH5_METBU|nr:type II/IV secretion system ATPase subunit [Methanococcoides burtonii]ABE53251.1 type II secretion system protein E [Methanococcoides burtonii DSM 6242]
MPDKTLLNKEDNTREKSLRSIYKKLKVWGRSLPELEPYQLQIHGDIVEYTIPPGFREIERYWVDEPFAFISILEKNGVREYYLIEPVLSVYEKEVLERVYSDLHEILTIEDTGPDIDREYVLVNKTLYLFDLYKAELATASKHKILYYLKRNYLGFDSINGLMLDSFIEDISCDGIEVPIFLYHSKYRNIKTNISFEESRLNSFVINLCQKSGKHISIGDPMIDATLPDGSRLQATLGKEITTRGSSFDIRKFKSDPITPIDLLEFGTCSSEMLGYFWLAIENGFSAIFAGGTASGKTSLLNAVSLFIPPLSKIVSIEDTREVMLHHDNWIAGLTRESVTDSGAGEVTMFDLLKASLRQRPESILVGEVRGKEALTLFQALSTGHTTYSTMHAGDVQTVVNRLENEPINVPHVMLQALDLLCIQKLVFLGDKKVRRTNSVVEFAGIDPKSGYIRINELYTWDPATDDFKRMAESHILKKIMQRRGWGGVKLKEELNDRIRLLEYLRDAGIRDYVNVSVLVGMYIIDPRSVISSMEDGTLADKIQAHNKE